MPDAGTLVCAKNQPLVAFTASSISHPATGFMPTCGIDGRGCHFEEVLPVSCR